MLQGSLEDIWETVRASACEAPAKAVGLDCVEMLLHQTCRSGFKEFEEDSALLGL